MKREDFNRFNYDAQYLSLSCFESLIHLIAMIVLRKYALITILGFFFILSFAHAATTPIRGSASYWKTDKFGSVFVEKQSDLRFELHQAIVT